MNCILHEISTFGVMTIFIQNNRISILECFAAISREIPSRDYSTYSAKFSKIRLLILVVFRFSAIPDSPNNYKEIMRRRRPFGPSCLRHTNTRLNQSFNTPSPSCAAFWLLHWIFLHNENGR